MKYKGFGLGCMVSENFDSSVEVIRSAISEGVTFLDTADFYGAGVSEMIIGEALKGYERDRYYISLKFGALMSPDGQLYGLDVHPSRIKNYLTHSLKRLRLDYVDLYQPCRIDLAIPVEETIGVISDLVKAGYVRHVGATQIDAETLKRANATHPIEYVELEYSLFNRGIEEDLIPTARKLGAGIVAFGVIAHGLLSGAYTQEKLQRGELTLNERIPLFAKGNIEKNIALVENLRRIADEKQVSVPQLVLAWALSKGDDIIPLIGTTKVKNFKESVKARDLVLSNDDIQKIEAAIPKDKIAGASFPNMRFKNGVVVGL